MKTELWKEQVSEFNVSSVVYVNIFVLFVCLFVVKYLIPKNDWSLYF